MKLAWDRATHPGISKVVPDEKRSPWPTCGVGPYQELYGRIVGFRYGNILRHSRAARSRASRNADLAVLSAPPKRAVDRAASTCAFTAAKGLARCQWRVSGTGFRTRLHAAASLSTDSRTARAKRSEILRYPWRNPVCWRTELRFGSGCSRNHDRGRSRLAALV